MNRLFTLLTLLFLTFIGKAQLSSDPEFPIATDAVNLTFDATGTALEGYAGTIYAHTGVTTAAGQWKNVIGTWGDNDSQPALTSAGTDIYTLSISPSIYSYYGLTEGTSLTELCFVFRSADAATQTSDLFIDVYENVLSVRLNSPEQNTILLLGNSLNIDIASNLATNTELYINDIKIEESTTGAISYDWTPDSKGNYTLKAVALDASSSITDSVHVLVYEDSPSAELPAGVHKGINYISDTEVTLVLYAPEKDNVILLGDFNDWILAEEYIMHKTADETNYWITLEDLTPGEEYAFQYLIDGEILIADPYTEKILDPWNDSYISESTYPNLKEYPTGKTTEIASVFQTAQEEYAWEVTDFSMPDADNLVIYELHIRDFVADHRYRTIADTLDYLERLGVNALELMPVNEFEGNSSWGYNPSFYFAPDKYYGPKDDLKYLIDECHKRGIAVILDMVLNHSFYQSPFVRMYFDEENDRPAANNPWYNATSPNTTYSWGADFNHESAQTKELVDSVNSFWMSEYKVDGFRFDFTKGFTQTAGDGWDYDLSRIIILQRMAREIWDRNEDAFISFEHLAADKEEQTLANYGIYLWGNMNYSYLEGAMGYNESSKSDFSNISYQEREWNDPHLVGYMESHDEERLMYKVRNYGDSDGDYNTRAKYTALGRAALAANFFLPVPGPKMIWQFGELGYEHSINECTDGSIDEDCRTAEKPLPWDDVDDNGRQRLYQIYAKLAQLKNSEAAFSTTDYSLDFASAFKTIHLNHSDMNVVILGNFDVVSQSADVSFPTTGTWYEYYSGDSYTVETNTVNISLEAGEYRMYTTKQLETPDLPSGLSPNERGSSSLLLYPNPVQDKLWLESQETATQVTIYNTMGALAHTQDFDLTEGINISHLPNGLYLLQLETQSGTVQQTKFFKQ